MKTIWKFQLPVVDTITLMMPLNAQVLCIQMQYGVPCLWALVDSVARSAPRMFTIHGTGHQLFDDNKGVYVGTFQLDGGALVFHVFDHGSRAQ